VVIISLKKLLLIFVKKMHGIKKKEWLLDTITEAVSENLHDVLRDELKTFA
jgi:hypothetical protein